MFRIDRAAINYKDKPAGLITPASTANAGMPPEKKQAAPISEEEAAREAVPEELAAPEPEKPAPPPAPLPPPPNYEEIRKEYEKRAKAEAEGIIAAAKLSADETHKKAQEEGYKQGIDVARAEAATQLAAQRIEDAERIEAAISQIAQCRADMYAHLERHTVALSLAVAEKILGFEINRNDEAFSRMVKNAVREVRTADRIVVRVNSADFHLYFPDGKLHIDMGDDAVHIVLTEDSSLPRGSLLVETPGEMLDASIRTQLFGIREAFSAQGATND